MLILGSAVIQTFLLLVSTTVMATQAILLDLLTSNYLIIAVPVRFPFPTIDHCCVVQDEVVDWARVMKFLAHKSVQLRLYQLRFIFVYLILQIHVFGYLTNIC